MIDVLLIIIFLSGAAVLWYSISQKIPELVAIPDQVIAERLQDESAKFHLFIIHLKSYLKEGHYKGTLYNFLEKTLYRSHIALLKIDNGTMGLLKKVRTYTGTANGNGGSNGNGNGSGSAEYWKQVKNEPVNTVIKSSRIHEVRTKK